MKRLFALFAIISTIGTLCAQVQQGLVKTRGRLDSNGKLISGVGIEKAIVKVKNENSVISDTCGTFKINLKGNKYYLENVSKKGYQLVDMDILSRQYTCSPDTLKIVLTTPEQQLEDELANERKLRRTLNRQLLQREDEIEELYASQKILKAERDSALRELYTSHANNEKLIKDMVERYSRIDFDQLDNFNRRISEYILEGELLKADSMLNSKGDILSRIEEYRLHKQANEMERIELAEREKSLAQSENLAGKKLEDLACDCYSKFELFKMQHLNDSAAFYIELRASLDTTNAKWQFDAGVYLQKQNLYYKSEIFYDRAMRLYVQHAAEDASVYIPETLTILNNIAQVFAATQRLSESEIVHKELVEIHRKLAKANPLVYEYDLAFSLHNTAVFYYDIQRFDESEAMYKEALGMWRMFAKDNLLEYASDLASTLNSLAVLYSTTHRFSESEAMYKEALELYRMLAEANPQEYNPDLANCLHNFAVFYGEIQRFSESETMFNETLKIRRTLANTNPQKYEPDLAYTLNSLAGLYSQTQRFTESERMYKEVLNIWRMLAKNNIYVYELQLANSLHNIATLYYNIQRFDESEVMYKEALEVCRSLVNANPQTYEPYLAFIIKNSAVLYFSTQDFLKSETMFKEALEIYRKIVIDNPMVHDEEYFEILGLISYNCIYLCKYSDAETYAREGVEKYPSEINVYSSLALALLLQGKYAEAEEVYSTYKAELKESFLEDFKIFEEAGIIPDERREDVEKIRALLNE